MSGGRPKLGPLAALMGTPLEDQQAAKPRANRLSRSSRQRLGSEQDSPMSQRAEFKTPTRISRFRPAGRVCGVSPHNDSDFQQDIIWDATSPSPNRRSKRGKTRPAGAVSISEIVSRIAPKHGRPEDADPTLQQWIGDSASIPCTPDIQPPKPKKKSPRLNAVDNLLKLAKQFDCNMFRQDEEEAEDMHQQSLELLSEDILNFENSVEIEVSPSVPESHLPAASVVAAMGVQLLPDQRTDDDLDFLFDGPTQYMSGNLSQASSAQSQVKPPREASWKPSASSHGPTSAISTPHGNGTSAGNDFEDDWGDDNLLNDSLVLEMTQNPLKFASPKLCSTQKPAGQARNQREAPAAAGVAVGLSQSAAPKAEKENIRPRATFLLESNPAFSVERIQNAHRQVGYSSYPAGRDSEQSESSSWHARETCKSNPVKPDLQKPRSDQQRTSAGICRSAVSQTTNAPNFPQKDGVSSHSEPPTDADFLNEDLDAFFLSEPVWDDPADDELLCEMCEDLERQILGVAEKQAPLIGQIPSQSTALRLTGRTGQDDRIRQPAAPPPTGTGRAAGSSLAGGSASSVTVKVNETLRFTGEKMASGFMVESACLQERSGVQGAAAPQRAPQQHATKDQFTFKRPTDPVSMATNNVRGKCSAAEIERKKQQAMERRRQRLQAARNLRDVT